MYKYVCVDVDFRGENICRGSHVYTKLIQIHEYPLSFVYLYMISCICATPLKIWKFIHEIYIKITGVMFQRLHFGLRLIGVNRIIYNSERIPAKFL